MFRSTALRNFLANGGSYFSAFDSLAVIKIYSGTVPANADAALGGATLLCTVTKAGGTTFVADCLHFEATPIAGVLSKLASETWKSLAANNTNGSPTFGRMVIQSSDTGALVTVTERRIQFTVGSGAAEANTGTGLVSSSVDYEFTFATLSLPAGS